MVLVLNYLNYKDSCVEKAYYLLKGMRLTLLKPEGAW